MSLVKRLRNGIDFDDSREAADRIEQLERDIEQHKKQLKWDSDLCQDHCAGLEETIIRQADRIESLEQLAKEMAEALEREQQIIPSVHFERVLSHYWEVCGGEK